MSEPTGQVWRMANGEWAGGRSLNWQNVIWREWRNCEDAEYARYLFELVADEKTGRVATIISATVGVLFGMLWAIAGLLVALSDSFAAALNQGQVWIGLSGWIWIWGAIGGGAGYWMWLLLKQHFSWRPWLRRLIPSLPAPQFMAGGLNWLGQRLLLGLVLGLASSLVGLMLEAIVGQGAVGPGVGPGLAGLLVSLTGISLIFGLNVGHHDGLILGTSSWLSGWLSVSLIFMLADWATVGLVSLLIGGLAVFLGILVPFLMSMLLQTPLWPESDQSQPSANRLIYFLVIGGLGLSLSLVAQLTTGDRATLNMFRFLGLHFVEPVTQFYGLVGLISWLSAGLGVELGVLLSILKPKPDGGPLEYGYRRWFLWWKHRPYAPEVKAVLSQASQMPAAMQKRWTGAMDRLTRKERIDSPQNLIDSLRSHDWLERFAASHALVTMGGKAIAPLAAIVTGTDSSLRQTATWILRSIGYETTTRLAQHAASLLCPTCLTRCGPYSVQLPEGDNFTYYGCRICGQSQEFWDCAQGVTAVLDADMTAEPVHREERVRVNWLTRRNLFDFGRVEIVQATDEDVERFAVQIGNDTDPVRRPRYKQIRCVVAPECELSENTLRILQHTFGQVEQRQEIK